MKFKKFFIIFIMTILFFSCNKKKENNNENVKQETEQNNIEISVIETEENNVSYKTYVLDDETRELIRSKITATDEEKEVMKEFIYKNDQYFKERNATIIYLEKANFGIPEGDNWVVKLNKMYIFIYSINDNKIIKDYYGTVSGQNFIDLHLNEISEYNIMSNIPGTHIPDGVISFGDFNGDGIVELFRYIYVYDLGYNVDIFHYDLQKEGFVYCRIPFNLIDPKNGPAPVEFLTYQGKFGFKVYNKKYHWETETREEGKWYFYTWDAEQRKYVEIGEIIE